MFKIILRALPPELKTREVRKIVTQFGKVAKIYMPQTKNNKKCDIKSQFSRSSKRTCIVVFKTQAEANKTILHLNNYYIGPYKITAQEAL